MAQLRCGGPFLADFSNRTQKVGHKTTTTDTKCPDGVKKTAARSLVI